ncbi:MULTISPECIES: SGNH/GDSL hydrolase family protein [Pseudomonas]|uniref:SGNH/GDSL hydrolase family protein n=1 Tax=Pseudomonas TaxID=286 RepID=UPI000BA4270E|nr:MULTISPECIES: SGNH/GDSL hydrolase family protein [Pseudomonas]MCU1720421.1 SGNH/GDSL hydrolase family protein [Pseudomonas sp. 5P_5.1_Bac1]
MAASLLAGLTILMIGDSHLATPDYLIKSLHDNLVQQGAQVHSLGVCGSKAGDWTKVTPGECGGAERRNKDKAVVLGNKATTQPISQLIAADKPDLIVVVMGDTMADYTKPAFPKTWIWQQTTSLTKEIKNAGTKCVWVGPNWGSEGGKYGKTYARVELTSKFLASNVAPCDYIDSLKFSKQGQWATIDGQHLTSMGYISWSKAITDALLASPVVKDVKK